MKTRRLVAGSIASVLALAGVALAQKAGDKQPAAGGAKPAAPAKPDAAKKEEVKPAEPAKPAPMQPPTVPQEMVDATKAMKGTWKCAGEVKEMMGQPGHKVTATMTWKAELGGFWLTGTYTEKKGKDNPMPYSFVEHRSYDAASKKWNAVSVDNMGGWSTNSGTVNGTVTSWEGKGTMGGVTMWGRGREEMVSAKEVKISGEFSMDGKSWSPAYEASCKK